MVDLKAIPAKWQKRWEESSIFQTSLSDDRPKFYVLEMFPYPSGYGIHMGHARNYTLGDVVARKRRMEGYDVLYPMGYDAFGLPAENAAIKSDIKPAEFTDTAIEKITNQFKLLGNSYDWTRMIATCRPEYYKWNQWFFIKFFEKGLAYRKEAPINWCPGCKTVLANEQVNDGLCWRCDSEVEEKNLEQWFLKITQYADDLLDGVKLLDAWPDKIRTMQENWIGKSVGVDIHFKLEGSDTILPAFTTRCDTIYSVTFVVIAPEHPLVLELSKGTPQEEEVKKVVQEIKGQTEIERTTPDGKDKIGAFLGKYAINPVNGEKIPIYVANFALMYGTGIVMADAHDQRDFEFAQKYNIPLKMVISEDGEPIDMSLASEAYTGDGILYHSGMFSGSHNREALPKMANWLEEQKWGKKTINFKLRDWLISRQRYWGTPIPFVYCDACGVVPVPEDQLPVLLPTDVSFKSGGNPMETSEAFISTTCPKCSKPAKRETDTMDTFFDSSWYFLRFCSPKLDTAAFDKKTVAEVMPVKTYIGGAEHAVMHLLYARFFTRVLKDMGMLDFEEPFTALHNQGMVNLGGKRMSKSKGNVVDPLVIMDKYGVDAMRFFLLFVAAPGSEIEWSEEGINGTYRFLTKVVSLIDESHEPKTAENDSLIVSKQHKCVAEVTKQIDAFVLNKALVAIMDFANAMVKHKDTISKGTFQDALKHLSLLLTPFTPHLAEEIWERMGNEGFISQAQWPKADDSKIDEGAEDAAQYISDVVANVRRTLQVKSLEKPSKITLYRAAEWKYSFVKQFRKLFETVKNPKEIADKIDVDAEKGEVIKFTFAAVKNMKLLPLVDRTPDEESTLMERAIQELKDEFGCEVGVGSIDDGSPRANMGLPGRPALLIE